MDKYKFNTSGDELVELVAIVVNVIGNQPWDADMFFDKKYSLLSRQNLILASRIYSDIEDFVKMANRLVHREPDIIQDAQKIVRMFQNTDDIEGQKFLFNIIKGIDRRKVAKDVRDHDIRDIYSKFLYNKGSRYNGFRLSDSEINRFLLVQILESERHPEVDDFKILVENAESFGVPDSDIEKIYNMLKYKYESEGTRLTGQLYEQHKIDQITKLFNPIKERIEIKKQQSAKQSQSDENMPQTLEEALELIRKLRAENKNLKSQNAMLNGIVNAQQMQHPAGGNIYVPQERSVKTI